MNRMEMKTEINTESEIGEKMLTFMTKETLQLIRSESMKNCNFKSRNAAEIGYILCNIPVNNLLFRLEYDNITGEKFMKVRDFFKRETGWKAKEILQIKTILYQNATFEAEEFTMNMAKIMKRSMLSEEMINKIKVAILTFDVEHLHNKIKHNKNINVFGDAVGALVNELREMKMNVDDYSIKQIYDSIAECFVAPKSQDNLLYDKRREWHCSNCGNYNFNRRVDGQDIQDLTVCYLCGVKFTQSLIWKIKGRQTFINTPEEVKHDANQQYDVQHYENDKIVVNIDNELLEGTIKWIGASNEWGDGLWYGVELDSPNDEYGHDGNFKGERFFECKDKYGIYIQDDKLTIYSIDSLMQSVLNSKSFDLSCPNRSDMRICPAILRLARSLIHYKRWVQTINDERVYEDIGNTMLANITTNLNDTRFHDIFLEAIQAVRHKRFTEMQRHALINMLEENTKDIGKINTFLALGSKKFAKLIKSHIQIIPAISVRMYKEIITALKQDPQAQRRQFDIFLQQTDISTIDDDYHHILELHINNGNKATIKNALSFFQETLHYDDKKSQIDACRSLVRRKKIKEQVTTANKDIKTNHRITKNGETKQRHVADQLDVYHLFLAHCNWKEFVRSKQQKLKVKQNEEKQDMNSFEFYQKDVAKKEQKSSEPGVTPQSSQMNDFHFGVEHQHPHLHPVYDSMYDELLLNKHCSIEDGVIKDLLHEAVRLHKIATEEGKYICKYYDKEYNITRNENISIRHIFALLLYADHRQFCDAFRKTCNRLKKNEPNSAVAQRHCEFYHIGRALYEAVEFYGDYLQPEEKLYHGVNRFMYFQQFTAWFNQPIFTTPSFTTAHRHSDGAGIILILQSGASDKVYPPKYIDVSWLSPVPSEKLFYGSHVMLEITDIVEAQNMKSHQSEMIIFNKFQKMLKNQTIEWKNERESETAMTTLITETLDQDFKTNDPYLTHYGRQLFKYFCDNTTSVIIRDYMGISERIRRALCFTANFSLTPMVRLFPKAKEIMLTEIDIQDLTKNAKYYIPAMVEYIQNDAENKDLRSVEFKSKKTKQRATPNSSLQQFELRIAEKLGGSKWSGNYRWNPSDVTHSLVFEGKAAITHSGKVAMENVMNNHQTLCIDLSGKVAELTSKNIPLHRWDPEDVCNTIQRWIYQDTQYIKHARKMMAIFVRRQIVEDMTNRLKMRMDTVTTELLTFMTEETMAIVMEKMMNINDCSDYGNSAEMGYAMFNAPVINLLQKIKKDEINGRKLIQLGAEFLKKQTGWTGDEVLQMQSILFQHSAFGKEELKQNMNGIVEQSQLRTEMQNKIKKVFSRFDMEELHYKIKNNKNIEDFAIDVSNLVDDLHNEEAKHNDSDEDFIHRIYNMIARFFAIPNKHGLSSYERHKREWCCNNCGNYNFIRCLGGEDVHDLQVCSLCGVTFVDSIIRKIKGHETFIDVNTNKEDDIDTLIETYRDDEKIKLNIGHQQLTGKIKWIGRSNKWESQGLWYGVELDSPNKTYGHNGNFNGENFFECKDEHGIYVQEDKLATYNIDSLMKSVLTAKSFDLSCPNRNDSKNCPSIWRLARSLIHYKRWLQAIDDIKVYEDIQNTIQVNIGEVDDKKFTEIFLKAIKSVTHKKFTEEQRNALVNMVQNNTENMGEIKTFSAKNERTFKSIIRSNTGILPAFAARIYKKIIAELREEAQKRQFGEFLKKTEMDIIDLDYHHILRLHINNGNRRTIQNVFEFFGTALHYDDKASQIPHCRSLIRRKTIKEEVKEASKENISNHTITNKWKMKQYYVQNQLDIYHSYLVHSDWEQFVTPYEKNTDAGNKDETKDETKEDTVMTIKAQKMQQISQNTEKYTSKKEDLSQTKVGDYRFGVEHQHPHLKPIYPSIYDELLHHGISNVNIKESLFKAVAWHKCLAKNQDYICKYYDKEFNIIRNEKIGIRHIFALLVYTDYSDFCKAFRETYRIMNKNETNVEVAERHRQLYHYSRALFEAIEFYGQYMKIGDKALYHGLNQVMYFPKFNAWFNQPISTTPSMTKAKEFGDGGIILKLKPGTSAESDPPKYFDVSCLSQFPHEEEKLFYGSHVNFEIDDIIEAAVNKSHAKEMQMLNKFQRTLQNERIKWQNNREMDAMAALIRKQQNVDIEPGNNNSKAKNPYLTEYGTQLFKYFCDLKKSVFINDYMSMAKSLKQVLFFVDTQSNKLSLTPMIELFPNIEEIMLTEIDTKDMKKNAKYYIDAIVLVIEQDVEAKGMSLRRVEFKSKAAKDRATRSATLDQLDIASKVAKYGWNGEYKWNASDNTHSLIFECSDKEQLRRAAIQNERRKAAFIHTNPTGLSYFMQITSISHDDFHVEITRSISRLDEKEKICIKEIDADDSSFNGPKQNVTFKKSQNITGTDVNIDEMDDSIYNLALYPSKRASNVLSQSNTIKLELGTKISKSYEKYEPDCVKIATVMVFENKSAKTMDVFWSLPAKSFGDILYKIKFQENDEEKKYEDSTRKEEIIDLLPYCIPFSSLPISFTIITICEIKDKRYESVESEPININEMKDNSTEYLSLKAETISQLRDKHKQDLKEKDEIIDILKQETKDFHTNVTS